ncbi:SdpI family protein [Candidatus Micrarchaeota archaeon]|nr:SdpI family protein [Candidatus Micrarchaeota archaeon]
MVFSLKKELHRGDKLGIAAIIISLAVGVALLGSLPDQVASHWNLDGVADGFVQKELFVFGFPVLMLLTFLAVSLLPNVKELKREMTLLHREYASFKAALLIFLAYVYVVVLLSNTDYAPLHVSTSQLLFPGIAVLLYYIGKILPRLKRNHLIGIRTPWTLQSDEAWHKTHLLGSKLFKALAVVIMLATLTASTISTYMVVVPLIAAGIILVAYSYSVREKKEEKKSKKKKKQR